MNRARVGIGFDTHRFDPSRPLVLGGVEFPGEPGLAGHSDADLVCHAIADALLGAAGLGDIGQLFPDTDERYKGANSLELLKEIASLLAEEGWDVANVDCVVVAEKPKIAPMRLEMQDSLTAAIGAPVSVKASRAEGLGAIGRAEGMACWATALLSGTASSAASRSEEVG